MPVGHFSRGYNFFQGSVGKKRAPKISLQSATFSALYIQKRYSSSILCHELLESTPYFWHFCRVLGLVTLRIELLYSATNSVRKSPFKAPVDKVLSKTKKTTFSFLALLLWSLCVSGELLGEQRSEATDCSREKSFSWFHHVHTLTQPSRAFLLQLIHQNRHVRQKEHEIDRQNWLNSKNAWKAEVRTSVGKVYTADAFTRVTGSFGVINKNHIRIWF